MIRPLFLALAIFALTIPCIPADACMVRIRQRESVTKHGMAVDDYKARHPLYTVWRCMIQRCVDPKKDNYRRYGGRGITVCDEWRHDFKAFYLWSTCNGWMRGLQLDRIDNDAGYRPDNCRWVTPKHNARNKRYSRLLTIFGQTKCAAEWAEDARCSISADLLVMRIKSGWMPEVALETPKRVAAKAIGSDAPFLH